MDFWQKARNFAEEAAKKSQELTMEAAKRSQELTIGSSKFSDIVSEASKRSKEIAAEASKRAEQIKSEASKRAEQIKSEAIKRADIIKSQLPSAAVLSSFVDSSSSASSSSLSPAPQSEEDLKEDLEKFGITDELREFVKGITMNTFRDFPLEDDSEMADTPTLSNIRQDLSKWQEKHAKLVLSAVKEISKLRYELCPRIMKERKFWRIYFIIVCSHVSPYEKRHIKEEEEKEAAKSVEEVKYEEEAKGSSKAEPDGVNQKSKRTPSIDQDLDVFLLGDDVGDSDGGTGSADKDFDDDFDKL